MNLRFLVEGWDVLDHKPEKKGKKGKKGEKDAPTKTGSEITTKSHNKEILASGGVTPSTSDATPSTSDATPSTSGGEADNKDRKSENVLYA